MPDNPPAPSESVALLFSGGRDSSLAACLLATAGKRVHLVTFNTGTAIGRKIMDFRIQELQQRFPNDTFYQVTIPVFGLFRAIALKDIEDDFAKYKKNLILLGSNLSMHTAITVYCLKSEIRIVADGSAKYQSELAEQMPKVIQEYSEFHKSYGLEYIRPVWDYMSEAEVKYRLFEYGVSTKSLEGVSIFGDTFSEPDPELAVSYVQEKLPICRQYIANMTGDKTILKRM